MTSVDNGRELVSRRVVRMDSSARLRQRSVILEVCGLLACARTLSEAKMKRDRVGESVARLMVRLTGLFEWPTFASRKTWWRVSFDDGGTDGAALSPRFSFSGSYDVGRRLRSRDAGRSILRVFYDEDIGLSGIRLVLSFSVVALRIRMLVESLSFMSFNGEKGSRSLSQYIFEFEFSRERFRFDIRNEVFFFSFLSRWFDYR